MNIDKCDKCGSDLLEISSSPYYENILGKKTYIDVFQGVKCLKCNNIHYNKEAQNFIKQKVQVKKTERMQDSEYEPILINYIRKLRLQTRLSQKMIGNALGVTEQRYGTIERNSNTPTVVTEHQIAEIIGVSTDELYKLIYISKSFYNNLKDMELIYENGKPVFRIVEEVKNKRNQLFEVRRKIQEVNNEKRTVRNNYKNDLISLDEFNSKTKELDKQRKKLVIEKGKTPSSGLQGEVKKLESKHSLMIKQENVIDAEDWEKVAIKFKDELSEWAY